LKVLSKLGAEPASQQNEERLIKPISVIKAWGKCEKRASIIVIASKGFIRHSPAVDGMAGEDENEMDGLAEADDALSQTKKKRNKKRLKRPQEILLSS
jgi:hypothetical protein